MLIFQELKDAWDAEGRVKSLKIAIQVWMPPAYYPGFLYCSRARSVALTKQCAKLLADTNVIRFYPSKFVLVTDILDTFGTLLEVSVP